LMWSAQFSNGVTIQSQHSCKRLGVLPTQTLRVHDLVCDDDLVYRWTGYTYMAEE
jgi:fructose-1,6-bisphosphatase/sedoheptulose 1,7-bisphosphatase-like protein